MTHVDRGANGARILIVGCGFPQLGLLRFCRAEGLFVVGVDLNPRAVGAAECDAMVVASTTDARAIAHAAREHRVDGLTTAGSDHAVAPCADAARELGLAFYAAPEALRRCLLKDEMRAAYEAGGAPSPAHRVVGSVEEARRFVSEQGLPVVVKPCRGWGQRGVAIVKLESELDRSVRAALESARVALERTGLDAPPACLVERFVEGREFSVDAYTLDGETRVLAVTERIITGYPDPPGITFAEVFPANVSAEDEERIATAATKGARALGIDRGPTYTQVRCGPEGAFLIETAYRLGGGLDPDVTLLASGVSLYRRIVGAALGRRDWESAGPEAPAWGGAIGRFKIARPGRVREVRGLDEVRRMAGVVGAESYVRPGDEVYELTDGSKRAGHVLVRAASRAEAEAIAAEAIERLDIVTAAEQRVEERA